MKWPNLDEIIAKRAAGGPAEYVRAKSRRVRSDATSARNLVTNLLWLPAIAVGAMQMLDVRAGLLTNQGADFFGPIALYASIRNGGTVLRWFARRTPSRAASASIVLVCCVAWELCQLYDFSGTPLVITAGRFDPWDLLAYVAGVVAAAGVERLLPASVRLPRDGNERHSDVMTL